MPEDQRATLGDEARSFATRIPRAVARRIGLESPHAETSSSVLNYLRALPFMQQFGDLPTKAPKEIGRGWNGVTYRSGPIVLKVNHDESPVEGFGYGNTPEDAERAQQHLETIRTIARDTFHLPHLITEQQAFFHVPGEVLPDGKERVVLVQRYYEGLIPYRKAKKLKLTPDERAALSKEFQQFEDFFLYMYDAGLIMDLWGYGNLALHKFDDGYHFVLCDVGPADKATAGPVTQIGLALSFGRECIRWESLLDARKSRRWGSRVGERAA